jgi:predicted DNA-binding antitoxin AbrB/MazE fold protein
MAKTITAVYDGEVLRPEEPLALQPNTRVRVTIERHAGVSRNTKSFLSTARSLNLEGPSDWSERIDDYLYDLSDAKN